ncbi:MAG: RNA pyrophosphohydrolase [Pseudomonadota bacterium]
MTELKRNPDVYRANVGLALFSTAGHVFLGRRVNSKGAFQWQMPQGGIDPGESPTEAAFRELEEEVGISPNLVSVLEQTDDWLYYDFPRELKKRLPGPYVGQRQKWFALRFKGSDSDIRLDLHKPEFDAWRWGRLDHIPPLIIPFKREIYEDLTVRFAKWTQQIPAS